LFYVYLIFIGYNDCLFSCIKVSSNGNVLRSEINGAIKMRVYLSGMPELRLGLNDKILFETTGRMFVFSFQLITNFYFNI